MLEPRGVREAEDGRAGLGVGLALAALDGAGDGGEARAVGERGEREAIAGLARRVDLGEDLVGDGDDLGRLGSGGGMD